MPRASANTAAVKHPCQGGRSFSRLRADHEAGDTVICYRCGERLGCTICCQQPVELICLICHNWGTRAGVERHGDVAPSDKVPRVRTDRGVRIYQQTAAAQEPRS